MDRSSAPSEPSPESKPHKISYARLTLPAACLLILCAVIEIVRSHFQLLWVDELGFGTLYLFRSASFAHFVHLELTTPVSFDAMGYNAILFAIVRVLGTSAFVMRLPAMCGFLCMQVCLFYFARRIAGAKAALIAMAIPAILEPVNYSIQARPYGLMLGLCAIAALSWQTAARRESRRLVPLVALALSLALAPNIHYYAALLFVPIYVAEAIRSGLRRRVDVPMLVALLAGLSGLIVIVPFARALMSFRDNVSTTGLDYRFISHSYLWLAAGYVDIDPWVRVLSFAAALLLISLVVYFFRRRSAVALDVRAEEWVLIALFCAFPVLAFIVASFGSRFVDSRYIQPAVIGIALVGAVLCAPLLTRKLATNLVFGLLFASVAASGAWHIVSEAQKTRAGMKWMGSSAEASAYLQNHPGRAILTTSNTTYDVAGYYAEPDVASRITLVVSREESELTHAPSYLPGQLDNMVADHVINVVPYSTVSRHGMNQIFLIYETPIDWANHALKVAHAQITPIGRLCGGDLVSVHFP
jgi:hypothetical protein